MEGGDDQAVGGHKLRALDLPAQDAQFMPQQEQLSLGIVWPKPDVSDVQREPQT
ncbi:MAG TPA: hypothetical protein VMW11_06265 [Candidatus Dormibacteraeota bacterium]|nr:hypothetical protein [Candidatus Dormibacteraeota bacterium]